MAVSAVNALYNFAQTNFQAIVFDNLAVVFQAFRAGGLFRGANEGEIADFEQFGGSEKNHVDGVMVQGVAKATLVDDEDAHAGARRFNGTGQARRPGSNAQKIVDGARIADGVHVISLPVKE
jgi:hypothetical protein